MAIYTGHPANVIGTQLDCITQAAVDPGVGFTKPMLDGNTFANAVFKLQEQGVFRVTSHDIAGALGLLDDNFSGAGASDVFCVPLTAAGGKTTASAVKHAMANSLAHWSTITAAPRQLATIAMDIHAYGSAGIVKTDSQTASSHTVGSDQGFVLHSLSVNGTAVTDLQGVSIAANVQVAKTPQEGSPLPGNVVISGIMPVITFRTLKANALLVETALNGTAGVVVVLGKLSATGGGFVSGANHLELTFADGAIRRSTTDGNPKVETFIAEITGASKAALCAIDDAHSLS
jgi:hypothetical protein